MEEETLSQQTNTSNGGKIILNDINDITETFPNEFQFISNVSNIVTLICTLPSTTLTNNMIQMIPIESQTNTSFTNYNTILSLNDNSVCKNINVSSIASTSMEYNLCQPISLTGTGNSEVTTNFATLQSSVIASNINQNLVQQGDLSSVLISSISPLPPQILLSNVNSNQGDLCQSTGLTASHMAPLVFTKNPTLARTEVCKVKSKYVCMSTLGDMEEAIRTHSEETFSHFVVAKKTKAYGSTVSSIDMKTKFRIHWQSRDLSATEECAVQIPFDGIPFIYVGEKAYMCHLGRSKSNSTVKAEEEVLSNVGVKKHRSRMSKKQGCPAKVFVKQIAKFPQFQIHNNSEYARTQTSLKVRKALIDSAGEINHVIQYIATLPDISEHSNHDIGENVALKEPIDPLIRDKILELSWQYGEGTLVRNIKEILEDFVENTLFKGKLPPAKSRRRFYPSEKDISNYIYKSRMVSRLTTIEQDNLLALIAKLKKENPEDKISLYFNNSKNPIVSDETKKNTENVINQKIYFSFQTQDQQRLLKKYGSQLIITELSKQTINLPFPFYGVFVATNVDYQLVYCFIIQTRNKACVKEGLELLVAWNPSWSPKIFTVDFSKEQIEAIELLFPGCTVLVSEKSREQTWKIWLNNPVNLSNLCGDKDETYEHLVNLAMSYTEENLNQAAQELENSDVWKLSDSLRDWFSSNWLTEAKRWVVGYRQDDFVSTIHLEYSLSEEKEILMESHYLNLKSKRLLEFISILVGTIIPGCYKRYADRNIRDQENHALLLKSCDHNLPFLKHRTFTVADHILRHNELWQTTEFSITRIQPGIFWIQSKNDLEITHVVSFGDSLTLPSCVCLDWLKYKLPCQHMLAIFNSTNWSWDMLSILYISNPIYNTDTCIAVRVCDETVIEKQPETSILTVVKHLSIQTQEKPIQEVMETIKGSEENERSNLVLECSVLCDDIKQNMQEISSNTKLNKMKLDLQYILNEVKLERSKVQENTKKPVKRTNTIKGILVDTKKRKLIDTTSVLHTESTVSIINPIAATSTQTSLISTSNNECWIYDNELNTKLSKTEEQLISNDDILTSNIIKNIQNILRHQFTNIIGLYDPYQVLHLTCPTEVIAEESKFLQIYQLDSNHWAMSAKINKEIYIFCCSLCDKSKLFEQFHHVTSRKISKNDTIIERVENEKEIESCSLYAIAYSVAFAFDIIPKNIKFNQDEMRKHLIECLEDMCFSMFPMEW